MMPCEGERRSGEAVLAVPPRLTRGAYAALVANDLVPRRWHVGGRHGSRTHRIVSDDDDLGGGDAADHGGGGRMGLPLIASDGVVRLVESMLALRDPDGDGGRGVEDDAHNGAKSRVVSTPEADPEVAATGEVEGPQRPNGREPGHFNFDGGGAGRKPKDPKEENDDECDSSSAASSSLREILSTPGVELMFYSEKPVPFRNVPKPQRFDATVHPERAPPSFPTLMHRLLDECVAESGGSSPPPLPIIRRRGRDGKSEPLFTFCELFAGIGGFGVALEAMGGRCVFASEINGPARRIYRANVDIRPAGVDDDEDESSGDQKKRDGVALAGDIWDVDANDVPRHDLLVGGFPCQPFSSLGDQPGLADGKCCGTGVRDDDDNDDATVTSVGPDVNEDDDEEDAGGGEGVGPGGRGRGLLYTQIVRILKHRRPGAFLLENVPGLLGTDGGRALRTIVDALEGVGYAVTYEVVNSRGLTAQSRKRLYVVGILRSTSTGGEGAMGSVVGGGEATDQPKDPVGTGGAADIGPSPRRSSSPGNDATEPFEFPFLPDLGLRAGDILHTRDEIRTLSLAEMGVPIPDGECDHEAGGPSCTTISSRGDDLCGNDEIDHHDGRSPSPPTSPAPSDPFRLTDSQMDQLLGRCPKYWKPSKLAWDDVTCQTLDGHYGVSVGKGNSQLVPCPAPLHPRKFTPRECARLMGFGDGSFDLCVVRPPPGHRGDGWEGGAGFRTVVKERYRLLGNAVCPPVVAGIAGAILDRILAPPPPPVRAVGVASDAPAGIAAASDGSVEEEDGDDGHLLRSDRHPLDWVDVGLWTAVGLALDAVPAVRRGAVVGRLRTAVSSFPSPPPSSPPAAV